MKLKTFLICALISIFAGCRDQIDETIIEDGFCETVIQKIDSLTVVSDAGKIMLQIKSDTKWTVSCSADSVAEVPVEWFSIDKESSVKNDSIELKISENAAPITRVAYINFTPTVPSIFYTDFQLVVTQMSAEAEIIVNNPNITTNTEGNMELKFSSSGTAVAACEFEMTSNVEWEVRRRETDNIDWLSILDSVGNPLTSAGILGELTTIKASITCVENVSDQNRIGTYDFYKVGESAPFKSLIITQEKMRTQTELTIVNNDTLRADWLTIGYAAGYTINIEYTDGATQTIDVADGNATQYDLSNFEFDQVGPFTASVVQYYSAGETRPTPIPSEEVSSHTHFDNNSGDGTSLGNAFEISSVRHLMNIEKSGKLSSFYKQTADIDFYDRTWHNNGYMPEQYNYADRDGALIGKTSVAPFTGTYSGLKADGSRAKMLNRDTYMVGSADAVFGVFGWVGTGAVISDLDLVNFTVRLASTYASAKWGETAFSMFIANSDGASIKNIDIIAPLMDYSATFGNAAAVGQVGTIGLLTAKASATTIENCRVIKGMRPNRGKAQTEEEIGIITLVYTGDGLIPPVLSATSGPVGFRKYHMGAVAGYIAEGTIIKNCSSNISLMSYGQGLGGICGAMTNSTIESCQFTGTMPISAHISGGIVGRITTGTNTTDLVSKCYTAGDIKWGQGLSLGQIGGIVGFVEGTIGDTPSTLNIEECYSSSNLVCIRETTWGATFRSVAFGGILGTANNTKNHIINIKDCYFQGNITSPAVVASGKNGYSHKLGGIVGEYAQNLVAGPTGELNIENTFSIGTIGGLDYASVTYGAIIGRASAEPWNTIKAEVFTTVNKISNCFALDGSMQGAQASTQQLYPAREVPTITTLENSVVKTETEMKTAATYSNYESTIWNISEGTYPTLSNNNR